MSRLFISPQAMQAFIGALQGDVMIDLDPRGMFEAVKVNGAPQRRKPPPKLLTHGKPRGPYKKRARKSALHSDRPNRNTARGVQIENALRALLADGAVHRGVVTNSLRLTYSLTGILAARRRLTERGELTLDENGMLALQREAA